MKFKSSLRVEPMKPTLEGEMAEVIQNLKPAEIHEYAPPGHTDRISASAQIMCDGIDRLFAGASEENQKIIDEIEAAFNAMKKFNEQVNDGMRRSAEGIKQHICHVTGLLEEATLKMQHNPFNGKAEETQNERLEG